MDYEYRTLIVEKRGHVGWLIFNRPDALNAFDNTMSAELQLAWHQLDLDDDVRVIVNTGRGRAFQTGVDLKEVPTVGDSLRDLQAGAAVGCETHFVRTGKAARLNDTQVSQLLQQVPGTQVHKDLAAFAEFVIARDRRAKAGARGDTSVPAHSGPGELR